MTRPEQIRKELLLQLYANRPLALPVERLHRDAQKQAYDFTPTEIQRELQFLVDEEMVVEITPKGSTQTLFRIGAAGVRHFEHRLIA